ncbi:ParB/RepB/Spo0J family partition protein [Kitasatospora sp. NPDC002965]|uniref:ParB/RepB/Spo0J family partition protein n=1 Tax=Kitasatospora sp. NPDC002965 TaxID=3154775 RepID=UPI0033AD7D6D
MTSPEQSYDPEVDLDRLTPHPDNPHLGDLDTIRGSIATHGWYGAVIAQRSTGHVIAGSHRIRAAREEGLATVPVIWLDIDNDKARRILLMDNRAGDKAGYDSTLLTDLLGELHVTPDGLSGTGWTPTELDALLASVALPAGGEWDEAFDKVPTGGAKFRSRTFVLTDEQADLIDRALAAARPTVDTDTGNRASAALAVVCEAYIRTTL